MNEVIGLITLFVVNLILIMTNYTVYLLLLVPPYLFVQRYSINMILFGGGLSVFMSEIIHQHALGSFMLGAGIAVFFFHFFDDVINWTHPLPKGICLLVYFLIVVLTRLLLIRSFYGFWIIPSVTAYFMTYLAGNLIIFYRYYFST